MAFVELDRSFAPVSKDKEAVLEFGIWARKYGGWLGWNQLLQYRRVILLAEASSGKTEEFRNQQARLATEGKPAFFIRIEELADQGFEAALEPSSASAFEAWRAGTGIAHFFLDSVDEARLNRKSFETALKRFARDLDRAVERAHILISCRVTDWKGKEDFALVERILPSWEQPREGTENADPLLDPIFNKQEDKTTRKEKALKPNELQVVQIVPLSDDQCRIFVTAQGVFDVSSFMDGVTRSGLDAFTERPGDILDLAEYWKTYGRFGNSSEMVEHGITRKLEEIDAYRADAHVLTPAKTREGAERLAAALTFGKSFTLRAPGHDADPSLASGAVDPSEVLNDWNDAERTALLRRGIFAPSTYGRIRFHHRTTQEYLTAQWLDRLLRSNCPREEVWSLVFADRYGVETLVPSLRPAAAWLAQRQPELREEIIRREPLVVIQHGDPSSLSLDAKKKVLLSYARKHARAEIADDSLDHRSLWLFTEPQLADTMREALTINARSDFRLDILRMIRNRAIKACVDIARTEVANRSGNEYHRIVALEALKECGDAEGLERAARTLLKDRKSASPRVAANFSKSLFPGYLSLKQLIQIVGDNTAPKARGMDGFEYAITELYKACPDASVRSALVLALADLCLTPPFSQEWHRISSKHVELARNLEPIAKAEVAALGGHGAPDHVVRLLMVVERADRNYSSEDGPSLTKLVQANPELNRALFWADVEELRKNGRSSEDKPTRIWMVFVHGMTFWDIGRSEDLDWLFEELSHRPRDEDKQIVLSAIVQFLFQQKRFEDELPRLRALLRGNSVLEADLTAYATPAPPSKEAADYAKRQAVRNQAYELQQQKAKESWVKFGEYVRKHIEQLRDPKLLASWKTGAFRLWDLSRWLGYRTGHQDANSYLQWRLLEEGFGREIAEAYRDGMKALWRVMKPERPTHKAGGPITTKYSTILAYHAVAVEAAEDPDWVAKLSESEARLAAQHGCMAEQGVPTWIGSLIAAYPQAVLPVIRAEIKLEWTTPGPGRSDFLHYYGRSETVIQPALQSVLFNVVSSNEPEDLYKLDQGLRLIVRLELDAEKRKALARMARKRLGGHERKRLPEQAMRYLALLFVVDPDKAVDDLAAWLARPQSKDRRERAEQTFAFLFDRDGRMPGVPSGIPTGRLEELLKLAYTYVRAEHDAVHEGSFSPDTRDHAEEARGSILRVLLDRPGEEAYAALRRIAALPATKIRRERFEELARGKVERDSEFPAWRPADVVALEKSSIAPVKTGEDLLRVVTNVLKDIQFQMDKGDVTSRPLIQRAQNEDEARNWLVEQMNARAKTRFHAYREAQIVDKDRPDIIIASTAAHCEVGMEVKHGGKKWTLSQLENALRVQLAQKYLNPATRRHGVFVITNHGPRRWQDSKTKKWLTFDKLGAHLSKLATTILANDTGPVRVIMFGLDVG